MGPRWKKSQLSATLKRLKLPKARHRRSAHARLAAIRREARPARPAPGTGLQPGRGAVDRARGRGQFGDLLAGGPGPVSATAGPGAGAAGAAELERLGALVRVGERE